MLRETILKLMDKIIQSASFRLFKNFKALQDLFRTRDSLKRFGTRLWLSVSFLDLTVAVRDR